MATDFGKRLRQARKAAGLTQEQLAARVGLAQGTISDAEKIGHGSAYTYQLAVACGVHPHWLATGEEVQEPPKAQQGKPLPSAIAMELAYLFDDIVTGMGPRDRAMVYQAAQEAITRPIARHGVLPIDKPAPTAIQGKQRV